VYLPLAIFLFVLLFPFYWMAITSFKPERRTAVARRQPVLGDGSPTLAHFKKLLFDTAYPAWLWNTVVVSVVATFLSLVASVLAAYAIERLRFKGAKQVGGDLPGLPGAAVDPVHPAGHDRLQARAVRHRWALILTYPTFLIPFCTWLLMGYFRSIPYELEECALIDGASRWQILIKIVLPLAVPGLISAGIFAFTLSWNEFIYALTFVSSSEIKTVPVGVVTELVEGDVYHWGPLMAGALLGSLPVALSTRSSSSTTSRADRRGQGVSSRWATRRCIRKRWRSRARPGCRSSSSMR
jgi:multiple sugar transport system permease protein